jgi:hypothetical protein
MYFVNSNIKTMQILLFQCKLNIFLGFARKMFPIRLSALSAVGTRFIRTSAAQFQQEKIFRSTRERPLLSKYNVCLLNY